ncbi:ribonuclease H-like domain-containing protein [Tanacetum coccineum]
MISQVNPSTSTLDVNNAFLYGDLVETVYIKPPEGYFHAGDNKVYRLKKSLYGWKQAPSLSESEKFKTFLKTNVMIKDLGKLKYFLGIEVIDTDKGICLNQRDLLSQYGMLACKPAKTPL